MSKLRKKVIKLAYQRKDLRPYLLPLVQRRLRLAANVPTYEEFLDNVKIKNPETDGEKRVKVRTLKNKPEGSAARKAYEKAYKEWKKAWEKEHGEPPKENEESEEENDEKNDEDSLKDKAQAATEAAKDKVKEKLSGDDLKNKMEDFANGDASLGDIAEIIGSLIVTFFAPKEGQDMLKEILDELETDDEEEVQKALTEIKTAEFAASLSDDAKGTLKENLGIDASSGSIDQEKLKEWLTGDEEIDEDLADELAEFFGEFTGKHVDFLKQYVKDGDVQLDKMRKELREGVPESLQKVNDIDDIEEFIERPGDFDDKVKRLKKHKGSLLSGQSAAFNQLGLKGKQSKELELELTSWVDNDVKNLPEGQQKSILKRLGDPKSFESDVKSFLTKPTRDYDDAEIGLAYFKWAYTRDSGDSKFQPEKWMSKDKAEKVKRLEPLIQKKDKLIEDRKKLLKKIDSKWQKYLTKDKLDDGIKKVEESLKSQLNDMSYNKKTHGQQLKQNMNKLMDRMRKYVEVGKELGEVKKEIKKERKTASLRAAVIKTAYHNPRLRAYLLPLID